MSVGAATSALPSSFGARQSIEQVEEGVALAPRFDRDGLIAVVTTDAASREVLMLGVMNAEALRRTMETGEAHYWSRSRHCLWRKGATAAWCRR
jgi:phosphoribosyl-AMP cyclohydrolase